MAAKELTYVLDEKSEEDDTIVGWISVPWEFCHIVQGFLPITAADVAKIERGAREGDTEEEVVKLRTELTLQFALEMVSALRESLSGVNHDCQDTSSRRGKRL